MRLLRVQAGADFISSSPHRHPTDGSRRSWAAACPGAGALPGKGLLLLHCLVGFKTVGQAGCFRFHFA